MRARLAWLAVAAGLGSAGSASAQSTRYPSPPVDKDAEAGARSSLWSSAVAPQRHHYDELVHGAGDARAHGTPNQKLDAVKRLDEAIQLMPHEPDAYALRGELAFDQQDWARCAADFAAAEAYAPHGRRARLPVEQRRELGLCQARAGKLTEAEATLAEIAAAGGASSELWTRLGEVRLAMGKLDEAIAALHAAIEAIEPASGAAAGALIHFLLAAAYDRARRPSEAAAEAELGVRADASLSVLTHQLPPVTPGEIDYLMGLAYRVEPARPELALAYFRRFVTAAPDSPWHKRADEHLRELRAADWPSSVAIDRPAPIDAAAARAVVRKAIPQLRACLVRFPDVVAEVSVVRAGPHSPLDPQKPRVAVVSDSARVQLVVGVVDDDDFDAIDRCMQPLAARLALPASKELDGHYRATFDVVAP